jgi:DNA primase
MSNAVEYIKEHIEPLEILNHYNFKSVREYEHEYRACCAIHHGNNPNAFVWNKSNNLWFCYTGEDCGGGDVFTLIQKIENTSFIQAIHKAAAILHLDIDGMEINLAEDRIKHEQKMWLQRQKNKGVTHIEEFALPQIELLETYSFDRFDSETINFYEANFCSRIQIGESIFTNKLMIPIYQDKKLISVGLRELGNNIPKWLYQPRGVKLSNTFYNIDRVNELIEDGTDEIILVEGIFDVWAYHRIGIDNVLAIFGSNISEKQYKELMKFNVKITFSFDNDEAGNKCKDKSIKLFENKNEIAVITLPKEKDPADCTSSELLDCYLGR